MKATITIDDNACVFESYHMDTAKDARLLILKLRAIADELEKAFRDGLPVGLEEFQQDNM